MRHQDISKRKEKKTIANQNWRLPIRVLLLTILIALLGMAGLLVMSYNMHLISQNYNAVIVTDYQNLEQVDVISQSFYQHRALTFQYMSVIDDERRRTEIEAQAKQLQEQIMETDRQFADSLIGTSYESSYHDIHSGLNGYFKNVDYMFEFGNSGDAPTAFYYMENMLYGNIDVVNKSVDALNLLITQDVNAAQSQMAERMEVSRNSAVILIILLAVFTSVGLSWCIRTSHDIANKDALTQVYNIEKLQNDMNRLVRKGRLGEYVCICCNIKNFTLINQRMSSQVGDLVLRNYAATIEHRLQKDERIARVGGDKFLFLVNKKRMNDILMLLEGVPITVEMDGEERVLQLESRCGVYAIKDEDEVSAAIDAAHLALSQAKQMASSDIVWYEQGMLKQVYDRKELLNDYKKGIEEREFLVYYQPKVNIITNTLCGCEALVRWKQKDGLVPPYKFVPVLEEEGKITELDFYVFEQLCMDIRAWLDAGITPVRISSNFSKLHLQNPKFAERVLEIVDRYKIDSKYLEVELTESSGYEDFDALMRFVKVMKERKIFVSIDDFGTGYSSLSLLKDLDADVVKLDKTFIDGIGHENTVNEDFVRNVIHMIKDLDRQVICEGVETKKQADFLREQACYMVQGYLYDKPIPHDTFEERLLHPKYEL